MCFVEKPIPEHLVYFYHPVISTFPSHYYQLLLFDVQLKLLVFATLNQTYSYKCTNIHPVGFCITLEKIILSFCTSRLQCLLSTYFFFRSSHNLNHSPCKRYFIVNISNTSKYIYYNCPTFINKNFIAL